MLDFIRNSIGFYNLAIVIGLLASIIVIFLLARRRDLLKGQLLYMSLFLLVGVFLGAHILFFLVGLPDFIRDYAGQIHSFSEFLNAFLTASSGLVFYGGLLGGLLMLFISCRMYGLPLRENLNNFVVAFPLFHFFGRIGCALTGCCYGIEYHGLFELHYNATHINPGVNDGIDAFPRFPVQLLEALIELIIFIVLLIIYIKKEDKYSLTCIYLLSYAVVRFLDEFLRGDDIRGFWGPLSTSQWISIAIIIGVVIYLTVQRNRRAKALPL